MISTQVVMQGLLRPDGSLVLEGISILPPGPVEITVRALPPASTAGGEDWWQFLQRTRAELEQRGGKFSTGEEINAYLDDLRSGDERLDDIREQIARPTAAG